MKKSSLLEFWWRRNIPHKMGNGVDWYLPSWWCFIFGGNYDQGNGGGGWIPAILSQLKRWKLSGFTPSFPYANRIIGTLALLLMASCGNTAHIGASGEVDVVQGFMSSIAESTMQVKRTKDGAVTVTAAQSNYDGTSVPNNVTGVVGTGLTLNAGVKTNASNNGKDVRIGHQGVQSKALDKPITTSTQSVDQASGQVLTNTSQSFAPVFGHK